MATILESTDREHFNNYIKFYWMVLYDSNVSPTCQLCIVQKTLPNLGLKYTVSMLKYGYFNLQSAFSWLWTYGIFICVRSYTLDSLLFDAQRSYVELLATGLNQYFSFFLSKEMSKKYIYICLPQVTQLHGGV